jgi:hypothetical protein
MWLLNKLVIFILISITLSVLVEKIGFYASHNLPLLILIFFTQPGLIIPFLMGKDYLVIQLLMHTINIMYYLCIYLFVKAYKK